MSDVLRFLGPVRERDFGLFWTARTMSILGDYVFRIAFITYLIGLTHSPAFVSAATATLLVPPLLFYLFGGAIADQVSSRRNIMITADLLRFGASAGIVIAGLLSPDPWLIVVLALVVSIGSGFFAPASFAFITEIVAKQRLVAANSALSISQQVGLIAGPLLGATLALAGGPAAAFAVDALTFLGSGLLLSRIRSSRRREPLTAAPRERLIGQLAGGLRYVIRTPWLVLSFAVGAVANAVFTGSLDVA
ncbi:MAG TPA: MFS transporter, partial [Pseudonocardiaceae bacterium]|nr:MFS transporter [Pseudonocardiaceae bacterium]